VKYAFMRDHQGDFLVEVMCTVLGNIYNAGSGREISVEILVKLVALQLNSDVRINCDQDRLRPDKSEVERLLCSAAELTAATGLIPEKSLGDGLLATIDWIRKSVNLTRASNYHL
jgi:nucleoside-diphosphate-sugar epimerase